LGAQLALLDTQQLPPHELENDTCVGCQPLGHTVPHWEKFPLFFAQVALLETQQLPPHELENDTCVE
jgi:hypothetical protein